ncbi:hypothetical protein M4D55_20235 [Metabacillus idriensis]|uniref:hypothetical protein n=1 Tax=Metabacillus idriensis TaxID=324768 RepID=UPI0008A9551A|nr:hypothetical protein [Metabacillus idriensis]MCM3598097.1 hypothetical protein [Metabacillus idriensis]OHR73748.1 hypothetical protein HMPREF3291_18315 [Bacillus sp. HMSC76G11]
MSNNATSVLQEILNERENLKGVAEEVISNTLSTFAVLINELKDLLRSVSSADYRIRQDNDSLFEFELSDVIMGLSIIEGTALIKDEKVFPSEYYEAQKMKSYKELIQDEKFSMSYTGMIVMYVKLNEGSNVVLSRFYVNKNHDVLYRREVSWYEINWFTNENLLSDVGQYLLRSIEDALFEFKNYWRQNQREFESISELSEGNKIGFK